jgi:hypothetical protein
MSFELCFWDRFLDLYSSVFITFAFIHIFMFVIDGNENVWGNANPIFCNSTTNFTSILSNFANDVYLNMPENVTCDCCVS